MIDAARRLFLTALAVAGVTAGVTAGIGAVQRPASFPVPLAAGVPRFYVTVAEDGGRLRVRARDTASGRIAGSVTLPGALRQGSTWRIAAAADHRHFVIAVPVYGTSGLAVFGLTLSSHGRLALRERRTVRWDGDVFQSLALSPDGTVAALAFTSSATMSGTVCALSLGTGKIRIWSGARAPGFLPGDLSFLGRATLAVPWVHYLSQAHAVLAGVRMLNVSGPGGSLLTSRLVVFRRPAAVPGSAIVTAGGRQIIASSCQPGARHTVTARVVILSGADGHQQRVLRTETVTLPAGPGGGAAGTQTVTLLTCPVLSVDGTGRHVLSEAFTFGRLDNGRFRRLPAGSGPFYAAW